MLLGGDEIRRTQSGNNNAYCQDNETSWMNWTQLEQHQEIYQFAKGMIAFRREHPVLSKEQFYTGSEIHWFASNGEMPSWADPKEKQLGCLIHEVEERVLCLLFNAGAEGVDFRLPSLPSGVQWHLAVDTFGETSHDKFVAGKEEILKYPQNYLLKDRSSAILLARRPGFVSEGGSL